MVQQLHITSLHSANPSTKEGGDDVVVCIMRIPCIMAQKGVSRPRQTPVLFFTRARIYIDILPDLETPQNHHIPGTPRSPHIPHLLYIGRRRHELSRRQRRSAAGKEGAAGKELAQQRKKKKGAKPNTVPFHPSSYTWYDMMIHPSIHSFSS